MCVLLAIAFAGMTQGVQAQSVAVKSNVLADAFLNPNLGIEVGLAPKWTLDVTGQFNAWMLSPLETLGCSTRSQILVLRPLLRSLRGCSHSRRTV